MARMLAPQCRSAAAGTDSTNTSCRLPASLLSDQVRRLAICAAVGGGLWIYGIVMDALAGNEDAPDCSVAA